jgi:hypothetical protein
MRAASGSDCSAATFDQNLLIGTNVLAWFPDMSGLMAPSTVLPRNALDPEIDPVRYGDLYRVAQPCLTQLGYRVCFVYEPLPLIDEQRSLIQAG